MSEKSTNVPALFGQMVFDEQQMQQRLPAAVYQKWQQCLAQGTPLDRSTAGEIANAMKDWAIEKGATHYTHWFQPMTGFTAEKHDSFITRAGKDGVVMELSAKELSKGEADASSFPSGGLRATFEARGYTAWDPTSYAFVKDETLYIPTIFCSYSGQTLDKKTPLLRSMHVLDKECIRILRLFGNTEAKHVIPQVGPEQEYFLIDKKMYELREDLKLCGRTLFGARPSKGQELDDHYYGAIKPRVASFMRELDEELWKLGVLAKTEHNEVAPAQHEIAPIYSDANSACDKNQLTMELLKKVAARHGLVCLLHEKPFDGINGSGKHNNWSMITNTGVNLLEPGRTPAENAQFLIFLMAVIKAVDDYADLLRISVASAGNDHRLGANEAPPAIISIFLGDELTAVLDSIENDTFFGKHPLVQMDTGATVLPHFFKDNTDRNRTSPFAFTGNKFEFRMPGSSQSIAGPTTVLNTIIADSLCVFADELEKAPDFTTALHELIKRTFKDHGRILFGGNGYDESWVEEAERRGLKNLKNSSTALPEYMLPKNVELLTKYGVYTESEIIARNEIHMEHYCKVIAIEGETLVDMVQHGILNAVSEYTAALSETLIKKRKALPEVPCRVESALIGTLSSLNESLLDKMVSLKSALETAPSVGSAELMKYYHDEVFLRMEDMRTVIDKLETLTAVEYWPYPSYYDMLFSV